MQKERWTRRMQLMMGLSCNRVCRAACHLHRQMMYGHCRTLAPTIEGIVGEAQGGTDHVFWFWESVFSAAESDFCPKKHAEAMALPLAEKVWEAELNEYTSHLQNGTFGPALGSDAFAPGLPLKAVWVYSHSKKEPGGWSCRGS